MEMTSTSQGYFSLLRWYKDPARNEARNVAIILLDPAKQCGRLKAAPLSTISSRLQDQGLLDSLLVSLEDRLREEFTLESLCEMHSSLTSSLSMTEPRPTVLPSGDFDVAMKALYKAYVAPTTGGGKALTKGRIVDKVVASIRRHSKNVRRGVYFKDYIFDIVLDLPGRPKVLEVFSFATSSKNWVPIEHDAGYFMHALQQIDQEGLAIIQPPNQDSDRTAAESHRRLVRWFRKEGLRSIEPDMVVDALQVKRQLRAL